MVNIDFNDYPEYVCGYFRYLTVVKNLAERTVEAYSIDIKLYLRYLKIVKLNMPADTDMQTISVKDVPFDWLKTTTLNDTYQFLYFVSNTRNNRSRSMARKVSALKSFYKYLTTKEHLLEKNPVKELELPSLKKSLPKYLSLNQSIELLGNIDSKSYERDYCIITLFVNCGMRLSELVGLNLNDIDYNERTMRLLGKGNKERIIYINQACIDALRDYLAVRPVSQSEQNALFLSQFEKRISKRRVQQIVENSINAAHLDGKGITTHKLRHTAATLMYQHGNVDTLVLKEILGHKSIATTEIYTHISNQQLEKAADSSPLSGVKKPRNKANHPAKLPIKDEMPVGAAETDVKIENNKEKKQ